MRFFYTTILFISLFFVQQSNGQTALTETNQRPWNAKWIALQHDEGRDYGVYFFRKSIDLAAKPSAFNIHVSADNRYKLFVNGKLVSLGPARGDLYYWNYETIDIASYLTAGKNTVAALVFNEAQYRPEAQISLRTGLIIQGGSDAEDVLNTNKTWKVIRSNAHAPVPGYFFAATKGEMVDMNSAVKGDWTAAGFDDRQWPTADEIANGQLKGVWDGSGWELVPSQIPQMEMTYQRIPSLRKATGITAPAGFPGKNTTVTIPANTTAVLLLDQTFLTNAYVTLNFSGGKDAGISLKYAETLYTEFTKYGGRKGNRNDVEGKIFSGRADSILSNGEEGQSFTTLNFRTFRYVQLLVHTKDQPLVINDIYGMFTGYPFKVNAVFNSNSNEIKQILDIGWRTARLNAWETYTDCPYYEQLQYIGDTRVQAMISYYYTGDDRLARNAINLMDRSRLPEGLTLSRYPSRGTQIISTFSLWYIGMLYDYWMYRNDSAFVKDKLLGARGVLEYFGKYQQADGSLKNTPYWTFVDWANGKNWGIGAPPSGADGSSAILDLQLLWAYQWGAAMEAKMGMPGYADLYSKKAEQLKATIKRKYYDPSKKLFADTEDKTLFSQHANSLAILTGIVDESDLKEMGNRMLTDKSLTQCTIYFKYYLHQALVKAGLGDDYINWLDIWRENIKMGLTTWTEDSNIEFTRSDCHAWGSSPNIEFFRTVLGVDTEAPGFSKIKVEPHLGTITNVNGEVPHPAGKVRVAYTLNKGKWKINISLPQQTTGELVWKGKTLVLKAGANSFNL